MSIAVPRRYDFVPGLAGMHDVDDYPGAATEPGLIVYRYDSPLFFANAENFRQHRAGRVGRTAGRTHRPRCIDLRR